MAIDSSFHFTLVDYIVLVVMFMISVITGIYFAYKDRKKKNTETYFFGNGHMPPIPVGLSLSVSFVSGLTVMGFPTEFYLYGSVWLWALFSFPTAALIACVYFIPLFHKLQLKSVYKYLELRYNRIARLICSFFVVFYMLLYMALVVYAPALALTALTAITLHWAVAITLAVCTFYTVIGGFKSVVWTDTFQSAIMVLGSGAILIRTVYLVGGVPNVMSALERGNRTKFFDFNPDPTMRCTTWTVYTGMCMNWIIYMTSNQENVQRYLSCKDVKNARLSLIVCTIPQMLITFIAFATGAAAYAYFETCDPVDNGDIKKYDQIIPLLVAKITKGLPGFCGLFVATVYCGTLSSVSSGINSITVIVMEDFVPLVYKFKREESVLNVSKLCGLVTGFVLLILALLITFIKGTIIKLSFSLMSSFTPPILGMFILGMFAPRVKASDAFIGAVCGFLITSWISIGSMIYPSIESQALAVSTNGCNYTVLGNSTNLLPSNITSLDQITESPFIAYEISFLHFRSLAFLITVIIGLLLSVLTCPNKSSDVNPKYFVPLIDNKIFPEKFRKFMRFGVPLEGIEEEKMSLRTSSSD